MKKKLVSGMQKIHWTTRLVMKYGTLLSLFVLMLGFGAERVSFMAISLCQTAVYMFCISIVGGILLDVIAGRKGMRDD